MKISPKTCELGMPTAVAIKVVVLVPGDEFSFSLGTETFHPFHGISNFLRLSKLEK